TAYRVYVSARSRTRPRRRSVPVCSRSIRPGIDTGSAGGRDVLVVVLAGVETTVGDEVEVVAGAAGPPSVQPAVAASTSPAATPAPPRPPPRPPPAPPPLAPGPAPAPPRGVEPAPRRGRRPPPAGLGEPGGQEHRQRPVEQLRGRGGADRGVDRVALDQP